MSFEFWNLPIGDTEAKQGSMIDWHNVGREKKVATNRKVKNILLDVFKTVLLEQVTLEKINTSSKEEVT